MKKVLIISLKSLDDVVATTAFLLLIINQKILAGSGNPLFSGQTRRSPLL
jgi:hypothetical protein